MYDTSYLMTASIYVWEENLTLNLSILTTWQITKEIVIYRLELSGDYKEMLYDPPKGLREIPKKIRQNDD